MLSALAIAALAIPVAAPAQNSEPMATSIVDTIPAPRDIPYPGTMTLHVDATDTERAIFRVEQTIPVAEAGRLTLLYPEWLPGNHAPRGPIRHLAGLTIAGNDGQTIEWTRDPTDVYAFHVDVPQGVSTLTLRYQLLSATARNQGRIVMTPEMLNLQWEKMSLYPAGYYVRNIMVTPSVTLPAGWQAAVALRGETVSENNRRSYDTVSYETLVDSPMFAGAHYRRDRLSDTVWLNTFADRASELDATDEQIAAHRRLAQQAVRLFGSEPWDRYDFLFAITDTMSGIGLEHHRSSENAVPSGYFVSWDDGPGRRTLLPHEVVHSWNGKYRRPEGLWTPDYRTPMQDSYLWVYEGQTTFWGNVLAARAGLISDEQFRETLAVQIAGLDNRAGRQWRNLQDTTHDPIIAERLPKPWTSWQRSEDYYREGALVWLEVDQIIRRESRGRRSLDDFARAFFGRRDGDFGQVTYDFDDIVETLHGVQPYDWAPLLRQRLDERAASAPVRGLELGGYRLVYRREASASQSHAQTSGNYLDLSWSGGLTVRSSGRISTVIWDSAAFNAGLTVGTEIVAVNGRSFSTTVLRDAVAGAAEGQTRIELLIKNGDRYRTVELEWRGGLRYPHLERTGSGTAGLDRLIQPLR
ncbi:MAG: M61 family metallopeptidase [Sphingomonadaceae bacterium]|nr:M61 family metallopeptidase [Sphingomonadaceae bacterium]